MKNPGSNRPYKWLAQHYDALFNFHVAGINPLASMSWQKFSRQSNRLVT
jgi:hypothetical protein